MELNRSLIKTNAHGPYFLLTTGGKECLNKRGKISKYDFVNSAMYLE
jgi:hypothetical protein